MQSSARSKAIASMVLGIVSLVFVWTGQFALVGIICGIIGLVLGVGARKELAGQDGTSFATAGIVCSAIGLGLSAIAFIACVACAGIIGSAISGIY